MAVPDGVLVVDPENGSMRKGMGLEEQRPTCLASDPHSSGRVWCGTSRGGLFRSDDAGESWRPMGLRDVRITALAASPVTAGIAWAGTEPSQVQRSMDGGESWLPTSDLASLPSSGSWAFPPRPDTHHVRWIACHPRERERLWVAIEAGALISTSDAGQSWRDRVPGSPYDTHELAVHPDAPETLRVAAGDGYLESFDGGERWSRPSAGLEVGYLRSVAIDPGTAEVVLVSAATGPRTAYTAGVSDGRLYRREGNGPWQRVTDGWPEPAATIAPLLLAGLAPGELWAADERGIHRSEDGGVRWREIAAFEERPENLRALDGVSV